MPTTKHMLDDRDLSTLSNICRSAAERYSETEKALRAMIDAPEPEPGAVFALRGERAKRLADQFARQASEALTYADIFQSAHPFTLDLEDEDDTEAA